MQTDIIPVQQLVGFPMFSVGMNCEVQLVEWDGGEIWLFKKHGDHWCSVRKATEQDIRIFADAIRRGA